MTSFMKHHGGRHLYCCALVGEKKAMEIAELKQRLEMQGTYTNHIHFDLSIYMNWCCL